MPEDREQPRRRGLRFTRPEINRIKHRRERESLLMVHDAKFREHMVEALETIGKDRSLQRDLVRDPAGSAIRDFLPDHLQGVADTDLSDANRLVMSAVANDGFRSWMDDYQRRLLEVHREHEDPIRSIIEGKNELLQDLAKALIEHGDAELLKNLLHADAGGGRISPEQLRDPDLGPIPLPKPPDPIPDPRDPWPPPMPHPDVAVVKFVLVVVVAVAVAIAVVVVAADSDGHTVDLDFRNVDGPQLRSIADQMINHAAKLQQAGILDDLDSRL
jgi:hypothetical protein